MTTDQNALSGSAATLDLWPIGNCQVSALVDRAGRFVWGCVPRVDGDPVFSALLGGAAPASEGFWGIDLEDCVSIDQAYIRNTPILVSRHTDATGSAIDVIDFSPRVQRLDRIYRPVAFARIVRPVSGSPRIRVRLRPTSDYGRPHPAQTFGSNHIRYVLGGLNLRLTTNAPISLVDEERPFRVERPLHFFLGPDETFAGDLGATLDQLLACLLYTSRCV